MAREDRSIANLTATDAWLGGPPAGLLTALFGYLIGRAVGIQQSAAYVLLVAVLVSLTWPLLLLALRGAVRRRTARA